MRPRSRPEATPTTLALVPARGGSRSIPRKNLKPLGGRPLLHWCLAAIRASDVVDRVCVSTDDEEIAALARAAGAETPFLRPAQLSGDTTPSIPVVEHALSWYASNENYVPDLLLFVQPTEPFVKPDQIRDALSLLLERDADSAITTVEVPRNFHPFHVRAADREGWLTFADEDAHYAHPSRQADPPRYAFANLYWVRTDVFLREGRLEAGRRVGLQVDEISALDLNDSDDWAIAEALVAAGAIGGTADDPDR